MIYISTSSLARNNDIDRDTLFATLEKQKFITRSGKYWILTDIGRRKGGKYKKNEKGEKWITWPDNLLIINDKLKQSNTSAFKILKSVVCENNLSKNVKIICLSNSFKEGGRCLAGIQISDDLKIYRQSSRAKWIRPVCATAHEEVPTHLARNFEYYDILEFTPVPNWKRNDYQSENLRIKNNNISFVQKVRAKNKTLTGLCDNNVFNDIFGNRGKSVSQIEINTLNHSLMMVKLSTFEVLIVQNEFRQHPQKRLAFRYNNTKYNLPITDSVFLHQYEHNQNILANVPEIFVVLSLGVEFNSNYYKLVATILF